MNKELSGKGYIQDGDGVFTASTGERYHYHDGELTRTAARPWPEPEHNKPKGAVEMKYLGTFELQPLYDPHQSFYGKASVERYTAGEGTRLVLKSYGTTVAAITPADTTDKDTETYHVEIALRYLSATTLRHVKEFLAQADDAFKGITLPWLRKAVKDGREIEGAGSAWRKVYVLNEL